MQNGTSFVNHDQYKGRCDLCDERFSRDMKRLDDQEENMQKVRELTIEMAALVKKHDEVLEKHDKRIADLERVPVDQYGKIKLAIITAIISLSIGAVFSFIATK